MRNDESFRLPAAPTTVSTAGLRAGLSLLRTEVRRRIAAHFHRDPAAVNDRDGEDPDAEYESLFAQTVPTQRDGEAFVTELRADGFSYETVGDVKGQASYEDCCVEHLLEVLAVLDGVSTPRE